MLWKLVMVLGIASFFGTARRVWTYSRLDSGSVAGLLVSLLVIAAGFYLRKNASERSKSNGNRTGADANGANLR